MKKAVTIVFLLGIVFGFMFFMQAETPTGKATMCTLNNENCICDSEKCTCGDTMIAAEQCHSNNNL